jgi:cytochrome c553
METHFSQVMTVHEAVIRGDLAAVRGPATWLAEHDAPRTLPPASEPFDAEMRRAARRTAEASTVLDAALGTADMLKTCGDCHRGLGTMPSITPPSGRDLGGVVGHMLGHQKAVDQMMQGLAVPSTTLWRAGADGFTAAPLRRQALPDDPKLTPQLMASEKRIHEVAAQAGKAETAAARAVFYGQIIATCADCHAVHRKVWGPSRR